MEENQPGTHSRGHPDSIHPLSHHAACSQPSLEADSPVSHISWSSYNTHTHTQYQRASDISRVTCLEEGA